MSTYRKEPMKNSPMNQWVAALRSGEYTQGIGQLYVDEPDMDNAGDDERAFPRHCCLGVACAVFGMYLDDSSGVALPTEVSQWLGVDRALADELVNLNDTVGVDFDGIANVLAARQEAG